MNVFQLGEPLEFIKDQRSNEAVVALTPGMRAVYRNAHVQIGGHEFFALRKTKLVITFLRKQQYAPAPDAWYSAFLKWMPKPVRTMLAKKPVPIYPELIIPAGTRGVVLSSSFAEGSSMPSEEKPVPHLTSPHSFLALAGCYTDRFYFKETRGESLPNRDERTTYLELWDGNCLVGKSTRRSTSESPASFDDNDKWELLATCFGVLAGSAGAPLPPATT